METKGPSTADAAAAERRLDRDAGRRPRPWAAGLLTLLGVGVGHAYAGRWLRSIACFVAVSVAQIALLAVVLRSDLERWAILAIAVAFVVVLPALTILDAVRSARRAPPRRTHWAVRAWLVLLAAACSFVVTIGFGLLLVTRVVSSYRIPSMSMQPTLLADDRFLVDLSAYDGPFGRAPARGDVVLYRAPEDLDRLAVGAGLSTGRLFVKRVVAVGGDRVERRGGVLLVNDQPADEPAEWVDARSSPLADFALAVVPADSLFVLGDNRAHSLDSSRPSHGPVHRKDVLGRVVVVTFSRGDDGIRWDRLATRVR